MAVACLTFLMGDYIVIVSIFWMSAVCSLFLIMWRTVSFKIGLVDKPNVRKMHASHTPLVGGIAIFMSILCFYVLSPFIIPHGRAFLVSSAVLVGIGVLDDRYELPVIPRIIAQGIAAINMMADGVYLSSFGHLWFGNHLQLGPMSYGITLLAIWAGINAFNMADGIDGLLASLSIVTFTGLAVCFSMARQQNLLICCLFLIAAIVPFMLLNLGFPFGNKLKVFMGDAGSTLMGFTAVGLIILSSQGDKPTIAPATGLWLIALPLMDMVAVMFTRIAHRKTPFKPDRTHLHHLLINRGIPPHKTLLLMFFVAMAIAFTGVIIQVIKVKEITSLLLFLGLFVFYCYARHWLANIKST